MDWKARINKYQGTMESEAIPTRRSNPKRKTKPRGGKEKKTRSESEADEAVHFEHC